MAHKDIYIYIYTYIIYIYIYIFISDSIVACIYACNDRVLRRHVLKTALWPYDLWKRDVNISDISNLGAPLLNKCLQTTVKIENGVTKRCGSATGDILWGFIDNYVCLTMSIPWQRISPGNGLSTATIILWQIKNLTILWQWIIWQFYDSQVSLTKNIRRLWIGPALPGNEYSLPMNDLCHDE